MKGLSYYGYSYVICRGIGARMKYSDMPKQFLEVGGKPIIIHTMEHFARHPKVDAIVVACKADWIGYLNELIEAFNVPKVKAVVPGGAKGLILFTTA